MAIKTYKPTSPGKRNHISIINPELSKGKPEKRLVRKLTKSGGRNNNGRVTSRHIGGGHKRKYRVIDFKRNKVDIAAKVAAIEYDPNRSANIALLYYSDGEKRYILSPAGIKVGDIVEAGENVDIKAGNCLAMGNIPLGTIIHNVEMKIGKGAQLVRSAGASAQLMAKEGDYVLVKLPSGEVRRFHKKCRAGIGQIGVGTEGATARHINQHLDGAFGLQVHITAGCQAIAFAINGARIGRAIGFILGQQGNIFRAAA